MIFNKKMQEEKNLKRKEKFSCTLCGICKHSCPILQLSLLETDGPRGKAILLKRNISSKQFYFCTLCKACEEACILSDINIVERIRKARIELVRKGITTDANKRMIENIRKYGNALGKIETGKKPELFCC